MAYKLRVHRTMKEDRKEAYRLAENVEPRHSSNVVQVESLQDRKLERDRGTWHSGDWHWGSLGSVRLILDWLSVDRRHCSADGLLFCLSAGGTVN